jgi:precorrin-6B methylase 1
VTKISPLKLALATIGVAIGIVGVLALRSATLSTHQEVDARQTVLVVSARTHGGEPGQDLAEMVEAQLLTCRLEVTSDLAGPIEPLGDGRFRAVLEPAMDRTNRRQFRGCVEDFITDHLQIDVLELEAID